MSRRSRYSTFNYAVKLQTKRIIGEVLPEMVDHEWPTRMEGKVGRAVLALVTLSSETSPLWQVANFIPDMKARESGQLEWFLYHPNGVIGSHVAIETSIREIEAMNQEQVSQLYRGPLATPLYDDYLRLISILQQAPAIGAQQA